MSDMNWIRILKDHSVSLILEDNEIIYATHKSKINSPLFLSEDKMAQDTWHTMSIFDTKF